MKLPAKPMSSPGRPEKYPPPLMRFLRSNVGSKSRGRSRSSPMFVRKRNAAIETQEPSSPKVTCMGQVRVRRSKQDKTRPVKPKRRCKWVQNASFCHHLDGKLKVKSLRPAWRRLALFCIVGFNRKSKTREDSSRTEPEFVNGRRNIESQSEEEESDGESKVYVSTAVSPPKNALLLTRCRSAPYRSSSLGSIFWGSRLINEGTEQQQSTELENSGHDSQTSKTETTCKESDQESRLDPESEEKLGFFKKFESSITSIREGSTKAAKIEELRPDEGPENLRPPLLTRCKSEPAKTGEKLDPEMNF